MIGQKISHYRILERLGEGGMGTVYLAEDTHLGRRVAVKFLTSQTADERHFRARFLREARAVSSLSHPHIATVFDYGETEDGQPFIVMEYVNGRTLGQLLGEEKLSIERAIEIVEDAAEALAEAHSRGIVHRDIKPSNIVITDAGRTKVLDFGLAKQLNETSPGKDVDSDADTLLATHTQAGAIIGTPMYLSPEQARGLPVDHRSDLFALGALLYETLTNRPAFGGASIIEVAAQIIHVNPPPPSEINREIPPTVDRIVLRALAKQPEERYQTAEEMIGELRAARASLPLTERRKAEESKYNLPATSPPSNGQTNRNRFDLFLKLKTFPQRNPLRSVAALLVFVSFVSIIAWGFVRWRQFSPYTPSPEALRLYEIGINHLRDGAPYQASKALELAVQADEGFALAYARLAEAWAEMDYTSRARDRILRVAILVPDRSDLRPTDALYLEAVTATVGRDFTRAVNAYRQIVALAPDDARALVDLGRAQEKNEQIDNAIRSYEEAARRDSQYPTPLMRLGVLYARQQKLNEATEAFNRAETLYEALGNTEGRTGAMFERGAMWHDTGRFQEARAEFERVLEVARAARNEPQQINALLRLSDISINGGDMPQAQSLARQAIEFAQSRGLENLATLGLIKLGDAFLVKGDYAEAERFYNQAREFAERNGARYNQARSLLQLGSLRIQQRRPDEALRFIEPARDFFREGSYRRYIALALTLEARAYRQQNRFDVALETFRRVLSLAEESNDNQQIALAHGEMGAILLAQDRFTEALAHYDEARRLHEQANDRLMLAYDQNGRAEALWRMGQYEEARVSLGEAARISTADDAYRPLLIEIELNRAALLLSERRFAESAASSQRVLTMTAGASGDYVEAVIIARSLLSRARAQSGSLREAITLGAESVAAARAANAEALVADALFRLAETQIESGDARIALDTARQAADIFIRLNRQESSWRAFALAARASRSANQPDDETRSFARRAVEQLSQFRGALGEEAYNRYAIRPDIALLLRHLAELGVSPA
jgi:serine/threonine protein kinase/predicted negative regulator of RcsB-dependent stress response